MDQFGGLRQVVAFNLRRATRKIPHPRAGDGWRIGFSRSVHPGFGAVHRAAKAGSAVEAGDFSRRRPLGAQAAEQQIVVSRIFWVAGGIPEVIAVRKKKNSAPAVARFAGAPPLRTISRTICRTMSAD